MSIQITIGLGDDNVSAGALDQHMAALGFARANTALARLEAAQERMAEMSATRPTIIAGGTKEEEPAAKPTRTRKKAEEAKPAISTNPEDRRPPEDDEATQAQDAADEQAEVEAARAPEKPLTVEDVKAAVGDYVAKFGMAETQQDGMKIFADVLGKPPGEEPYWKLSLLASATQDQLQKVIVAWKTAAAAQTRYVAKE